MNKYLLISMIFIVNECYSGDFEDGLKAESIQDHSLALSKYKLAAKAGSANAKNKIGFMFQTGSGVAVDYEEAIRWYKLAVQQGQSNAMYHLGYLYSVGNGVPQNYEISHMWFNLAVANGEKHAVTDRTSVERKMSTQQISNAQKMAIQCKNMNYLNCN